ncbi:MAG: hypothetical protein M5U28_52460 [Sandaracinaceae bacterium]|nr:hypothetical protein [Sandaracinaceae bacterium]
MSTSSSSAARCAPACTARQKMWVVPFGITAMVGRWPAEAASPPQSQDAAKSDSRAKAIGARMGAT